MRIAIGSDHGGYGLKQGLIEHLKRLGHSVKDFGCYSEESCDYPLYGREVARAVSKGKFRRAILICKTGIGMSMSANKFPKVRAANIRDLKSARLSRQHNDANVLTLGAGFVSLKLAKRIIAIWFKTPALGGRHRRRVRQIR